MRHFFLALSLSAFAVGCQSNGFRSADDLESQQRGPKACAASCESLGLEMAAFVLFETQHSGCICAPKNGAHPGATEHPFADSLPPEHRQDPQTTPDSPLPKPVAPEESVAPAQEAERAESPGTSAARKNAVHMGTAQLAAFEAQRHATSQRRQKSDYYGWQP